MNKKRILDVTAGGRSIWFDKQNPETVFCDKRNETIDGKWKSSQRTIIINPDVVCDFTDLPFEDNSFYLVVFDPPHLEHVGNTSWLYAKYGRLEGNWEKMIHDGFKECMRVLKPNGTLVFKWSEVEIPTRKVINAIGQEPLFGHRSGKKMNTHWMCFMKDGDFQ
jgi:ubiquinone/menaquinone biosynthesis C-methylase UbiE